MIIIYSILTALISIVLPFFAKRKINFFISSLIIFTFLSPTTKIFGIQNGDTYNMALFRYLELSIIFLVIISVACTGRLKIRKIDVFLCILFLYQLIIFKVKSVYYGFPMESMPYNYLKEIFCFVFITLFFDIFYNKINNDIFNNTIIFSFFIVILLSSFLSIGCYIGIDELKYIHKEFYNVYLEGIGTDRTIYDFAENENRFFAFFSGPNQFSILSSIGLLYFYFNFKLRKISLTTLVVLIILTLLILISTQSRTGFFLFSLSLFLIYKNSVSYKTAGLEVSKFILYTIFILLFTSLFLYRTVDVLSVSGLFSEDSILVSQRINFWDRLINVNANEPSTIFLGAWNHLFIENEGVHVESGLLSAFAQSGIIGLVLFIIAILNFNVFKKNNSSMLKWNYYYYMNKYIGIIIIIAEVFQGNLLSTRMTIFYAILYAYFVNNNKSIICSRKI